MDKSKLYMSTHLSLSLDGVCFQDCAKCEAKLHSSHSLEENHSKMLVDRVYFTKDLGLKLRWAFM